MSDPDASAPADEPGEPKGARSNRLLLLLLPALALLVGIGIGALLVGVAGDDGSDPDTSPTPPATETTDESPSDLEVTVPAECIAVADTAEEAARLIRGSVDAVRDFRRDELVELLDRLEELDRQARGQAQQCRDTEVSRTEGG